MMKKFAALILTVMLALSLAACATTKGGENMKVKCPACGYQFEVPADGGR
ncbi:hypothetical protein [Geothermobacter hydrogeniphilus]|nr:hypothetical protein [Geothermobacter hydrogeniphilus]